MRRLASLLLLSLLAGAALPLLAQEPEPQNAIEALQRRLDRGETQLKFDPAKHGYLESLLAELGIAADSQVLPFSQSSFQFKLISPHAPRAIYFNDDIAIASVKDGTVLEIMANNRDSGVGFYVFPVDAGAKPRFQRDDPICAACHALVGNRVIGWMVADITTMWDGQPQIPNPTRPFDFTDHTTPFENRWGGWYVTGTTPGMRHRGNVTSPESAPYELPPTAGLNVTSLSGRFDGARLLSAGSDVVALMVLEHQTGFTNRVLALDILYSEDAMQQLASYMMFEDEVPLPGAVAGTSGYAARFAASGPRDAQGRSLREFDLKTRLFRHPLSYMIYSTAFDALRPDSKEKLLRRLHDRLRRTREGRAAIAIAAATKPGLPAYWKTP